MSTKKTLQDIIDIFAEKQNLERKEAELFVKGMFDLIEEALATEKYVKVKGLGTFKLTEVDSRESVDVNTGERIEIQGHTKVSFTPDSTLKELINKPFSHFETVILDDDAVVDDTMSFESAEEPEEGIPAEIPFSEEAVTEEAPVVEEEVVEEPKEEVPAIEDTPSEEATEPVADEPEIIAETPEATQETPEECQEETTESEIEPEKPEEEAEPEKVEPLVDTPVISEEVKKEAKKNHTGRIILIAALVLIILFALYWLFARPAAPAPEEMQMPVQKEATEAVQPDTIVVEVEEQTPEPQAPVVSAPASASAKVASLGDTLDYRIVGTQETYTMQSGETIIKASLKFFGHKNFWPYIAKHNEKTIKNPNNISAGTKIKIPKLEPKN